MKTIVRYFLATAALGALGLFTGCATPNKGRIARVTPMSFEIRVVDSSSARMLPPEELNILRANLVRYLADQEGLVSGRKYFLRVDYTSEKPGEPGEWLLVEISSPLGESYSVATAYRNSSPYYYPDHARPGYSTFYSSYQDPYDYSYGGGHYRPAPVIPPRGHQPHGRADRPRGDYTPGDGRGHDRNRDHRPRTADNTPRSDDSGRGRGRDSDNSGPTTARVSDNSSGNPGGGNSHTPSPSPSSSSSQPPPSRAESSNTGIQKMSAQEEQK